MEISTEQVRTICRIRKGELHVHLNGLVSAGLVRSILQDEKADIPHGFDLQADLIRRMPCASLSSYLKSWHVLRRIPSNHENFARMCDDAFQTLSASNVGFVELRSSVLYLAGLQNCSVPEALQRLIVATATSGAKHGIARGIVLTVTRGDYSAVHLDALLHAYRALDCPPDVVGIDLAGDEETPFPEELPGLFRAAKDRYGLGVTIHAGETGRPENILSAIRDFRANRIGHGTAAASHPEIMEELCEQDVCVEVCPISNRLTGALRQTETHPMREFLKGGVPFVICSDNPGIHERDLNEDYQTALSEGLDVAFLEGQFELAKKYTFLEIAA
jgi:adenosine deaminase